MGITRRWDGIRQRSYAQSVVMQSFSLQTGRAPLLISVPHAGTHIPGPIAHQMTEAGLASGDTDWFVDQLYAPIARELNAALLVAENSRYVVDLNRPADGAALYPGKSETALCPVDSFDEQPLYQIGLQPESEDIQLRVTRYWKPYHAALAATLNAMRAEYGSAILWDAHSIRSKVPRFFDGELPVYNLGTVGGTSCGASVQNAVFDVLQRDTDSAVLNGRFKGGYTTRAHGDPQNQIHALQLELAQRAYMDEEACQFQPEKAQQAQTVILKLLQTALEAV